jgi:hypothetical protein
MVALDLSFENALAILFLSILGNICLSRDIAL